jgi:hypothetical protein
MKIQVKYWKRCVFEIAFNSLGMPMFSCRTHSKIKGKYLRAKCLRELYKVKGAKL